MLDFTNQVVVVTGSGSPKGIGRTIAKTFANQGAKLVIVDINEAGVNETVDIIKESGHEALGIKVKNLLMLWSKQSWTNLVVLMF